MNSLKNKVSLIGRLGAQPEFSTVKSGKALARFSMATNERYKDKNGQWQDLTQWHNITAWGKIAESIQALEKGQEILLEGKLVHQTYEDKNGEKKYATVVDASDYFLIAPKPQFEKINK